MDNSKFHNISITNITEKFTIGNGTKIPLPKPFHWLTIEPGKTATVVCTDSDMTDEVLFQEGFTTTDVLRSLIQKNVIAVDKTDIKSDGPIATAEMAAAEPANVCQPESIKKDTGKIMANNTPDPDPLYAGPPDMVEFDPRKAIKTESAAVLGTVVDLPAADYTPPAVKSKEINDKFTSAVKMAFVGCGQGGGRICDSFFGLGYSKVCAVNTTEQDLVALNVPNKLVIGKNMGGAGKDPEQGKTAARESYEEIMDLLMRSWGEGVEQAWVTVGAGGGSGTGTWSVLVDAVKDYCKSTNVEKPVSKRVGVIMSLPKRSEGARVQKNALTAVKQAIDMAEKGQISTLIVLDNAKISDLFPGLPVKQFWTVANQNFAAMLHTFNLLAAQNSEYHTFDKEDFRSVLRNGMMIFGMTKVEKWSSKEDISQAVRQNLKNSLLADGFDLSKATMAGAVIVANNDVLESVPMENLDYAMFSLGRTLGNDGITIHNGIYEGKQPGMRVFTIVSGLESPAARLQEMASLSA